MPKMLEKGANANGQDQDQLPINTDQEMEDSESNQSTSIMEVRSVFAILDELRSEIKSLRTDFNKIKVDGGRVNISQDLKDQCKQEALQCFSDDIEENGKKIEKLEGELQQVHLHNKILTEVADNMAIQMQDINARIDSLEIKNSRSSITLTGLYVSEKKDEMLLQLQDFFMDTLGLEPAIDDAYTMGTSKPKLIVVVFQNLRHKKEVMQAKKLLKGIENKDGKPFYIQDHQPTSIMEKRKRERKIVEENEKKEKELRVNMQMTKGKLVVQGQVYKQKVHVPTPREMAATTLDQYDAMMKTKMKKSKTIENSNSRFIAYTKPVNTHHEIRELYKRMKINNPGARHIVCAYIIKGEEYHYSRDYCDDEEPGAGRIILNWMEKNDLTCRVFFIVRHYGSIKLGPERFTCYVNAAESALDGGEFNYHTNETQTVQKLEEKKFNYTSDGNGKTANPVHPKKTYPPNYTNQPQPEKPPAGAWGIKNRGGGKGGAARRIYDPSKTPSKNPYTFQPPHDARLHNNESVRREDW